MVTGILIGLCIAAVIAIAVYVYILWNWWS